MSDSKQNCPSCGHPVEKSARPPVPAQVSTASHVGVPRDSDPERCASCGAILARGAFDETKPAAHLAETVNAPTHGKADSADTAASFGPEFLAQYEMVRPLGRGGMGAVYLMRQVRLDRLVAVKVIRDDRFTEAQVQQLFIEARILAALNHPNIVTIHDVGTDGKIPHMVCEFVDGESLTYRLKRAPALSLPDMLLLVLQILDGLKAAHDKGIIHRDLKPDNVLLTRGGWPKINDFGLARSLTQSEGLLAGTISGTPRYMSPEQCRGLPTTAASDLYSLGVLLFELFTGHPPFRGPTTADYLYQHLHEPPPDIRSTLPDFPSTLQMLLTKTLEKDSALRLSDCLSCSKAVLDSYRALTSTRGPVAGSVTGGSAHRLGEFELLSRIGRGGMGVVYRAWQASLGRQVALKCLLQTHDANSQTRFLREIQALGRVENPHLVKVFTSGVDGDQLFYAMELVEGATLEAISDDLVGRSLSATEVTLPLFRESLDAAREKTRSAESPIDSQDGRSRKSPVIGPGTGSAGSSDDRSDADGYVRRVVELARQVAEAAHALHEAGVVHRDLKPGNVIVTPDGTRAVLMDLGLAQLADEGEGRLTRTRQFVGTLRYASPEQVLSSGRIDRRSDIYSLGATLWELLTLQPLHGAGDETSTLDLMHRIQDEEPDPLRKHHRGISVDLEAIVLKCLEKDPADRYETAQKLAEDLQRFLSGEPVRVRSVGRMERAFRWMFRRPAQAALLAFSIVGVPALVSFLVWYWDAHSRLKVGHYATVVIRWGVSEGCQRLTNDEVSRRNWCYRISTQGGRVRTVETVNGRGVMTNRGSVITFLTRGTFDLTACRQEYVYDERGLLTEETAYDIEGQLVWRLRYTDKGMAQYTDRRGLPLSRVGSGASYVGISWSPEGWPREIRFFDATGQPRPNRDGAFCWRFRFDSGGRAVEWSHLGSDDRLIMNKQRYASLRWAFDERSNMTEWAYFDLAGRPVLFKDGYSRMMAKHDRYGNQIERCFLDTEGRTTLHQDGYARVSSRYDAGGDLTDDAFFDSTGKPTLTKTGFSRGVYSYDDQGNLSRVSFFGPDGRSTLCTEGFAGQSLVHDSKGNVVEKRFFGLDGKPTLTREGFARITQKYDPNRNPIDWACFGVDGEPTYHPDGYSRMLSRYDDRRNVLESSYLDVKGRPVLNKDGYARVVNELDHRGNLVSRTYHGVDGKPALTRKGFAREVQKFDEQGHCIEWTSIGPDGEPVCISDGYARFVCHYDKRGNVVERDFFGVDGQPAFDKDGYTGEAFSYDDRGNVIESSYRGPDGKPSVHNDGYSKRQDSFDARGDLTESRFCGPDGRPALRVDGYSIVRFSYDNRGLATGESFFGVDGRPVAGQEGCARIIHVYDDRRNLIEVDFFGPDGKSVSCRDGYAKQLSTFDPRGKAIRVTFRGPDGNPCLNARGVSIVRRHHDERGNLLREEYFGPDGKPVLQIDGYARVDMRYDARGNCIERATFGIDGRPKAPPPELVASSSSRYDSLGRLIEETYRGVDGKPCWNGKGYSVVKYEYDAHGNNNRLCFFGLDGKPAQLPDGYSELRSSYDSRGNELEKSYFGADGKPALNSIGFSIVRTVYDRQGRLIKRVFSGADGRPAKGGPIGCSRLTRKYDAQGRLVEESRFDLAGQLLKTQVVIARVLPGGQAARLGLRSGDVCLRYDGALILSASVLVDQRRRERAGESPKWLLVRREGREFTVLVSPGLLLADLGEERVASGLPDKR